MTQYTVQKIPVPNFPSNIYYHTDDDLLQMFNEVMAALEEETMTPEDLQKKLRWAQLRNFKWLAGAVGLLVIANGFAAGACYVITGSVHSGAIRIIVGIELSLLGLVSLIFAIWLGIHQFVD